MMIEVVATSNWICVKFVLVFTCLIRPYVTREVGASIVQCTYLERNRWREQAQTRFVYPLLNSLREHSCSSPVRLLRIHFIS